MTNILQDGATWLSGQLKTAAGRTVTYRRGQLVSDAFTAAAAQNAYEVTDEDGFRTTIQTHDWIVEPADITLRSVQYDPRPGDRISETLNGSTVTYEVTPVGDGPCFEWLDGAGVMLVIHTKRIV